MKIKLKLMMLSILALSLFGCEKLGTSGGGVTLEPISVMGNNVLIGHPNDTMAKDIEVTYDRDKIKNLDEGFESKKAIIRENVHLKFKADEKDIKFKGIENRGNMYFDAKREETRFYKVNVDSQGFSNHKEIVVKDGNEGSLLKINGSYNGGLGSSISLGLYSVNYGKNLSTDRVHITGNVTGKTRVNFIYDEKQYEHLKDYVPYYKNDYVIQVDGKVIGVDEIDAFKMEKEIPVGQHLLELKHKKNKEGNNIWKLEKKK